jgi:hypothetical protein
MAVRILPGGEERGRVSREESGKGGNLGGAPVVERCVLDSDRYKGKTTSDPLTG